MVPEEQPTLPNESAARPLFDGRYRIVRPLGRGGFGEVQLVQDTLRKDARLALKSILPEHAQSAEFEQRFHREIDVLRTLQHPSIPQIVNDGRTPDGTFYFTMEFVDGTRLGDVVEADGPFSPLRLARVTRQLAQVLDYAHSRGVVHRDLKPSNIIVENAGSSDERVHVLDFGIAKLLERKDSDVDVTMQTAGFIGTPEFASPEQVLGESVDGRTDTYALGILIHFLATGKFPFTGKSRQEIATKRLHTPPTPLRRDEAPREIRALVSALLERDREQRPALESISKALDSVLGELASERRSGRRLAALLGVSGAFAASLATLALVMDRGRGGSETPEKEVAAVPEAPLAPAAEDNDGDRPPAAEAEEDIHQETPKAALQAAPKEAPQPAATGTPEAAQEDEASAAGPGGDSALDPPKEEPGAEAIVEAIVESKEESPAPGVASPPLRPTIEAPAPGTSVAPNVESIEITGRLFGGAEGPARDVRVGGLLATVDGDTYRATVPLKPGTNVIEVMALEDGQERSAKSIEVQRRSPRLPAGATPVEGAAYIEDMPAAITVGDPAVEFVLVAPGGDPLVYMATTELSRDQASKDGALPVVDISFADAESLARSFGGRLPTEDEWLRAARPEAGGLYPWGAEWTAKLCNGKSAGVGAPVQVTSPDYAAGRSWCGLWHSVGNVAEWATKSGEPVVLGGSYRSRDERLRLEPQTPRGVHGPRPDIGLRIAIDLP